MEDARRIVIVCVVATFVVTKQPLKAVREDVVDRRFCGVIRALRVSHRHLDRRMAQELLYNLKRRAVFGVCRCE